MARTLPTELTTAQRDASRTPFIQLVFHSRDRATTFTHKTTDTPNRIMSVQSAEGRFGSFTLIEGRPYNVSSIIRLQNSDNSLTSTNFKGYRVYIEWGFNTTAGNQASRAGPEFVISSELVSEQGVDYLELHTINMWERVNLLWVNTANAVPNTFKTTKVTHILLELLGGRNADSIQQDDGGVFTDFTSEAASETAGDVDYFPVTPVAGDVLYIGDADKFDRISMEISQILSSGSITLVWEYSLGSSSWGTLTSLTPAQGNAASSHANFTALGFQIEAFDIPADWATDTVNSVASKFWIRARVSAVSSPVQQIQGTRATVGLDFAYAHDTATGTGGDTATPEYETTPDSTVGQVVEDILASTTIGLTVREDGFHSFVIDPAQGSPDLIYDITDGPHFFFIHQEATQIVIPNQILVVSSDLDAGVALFKSDVTNGNANNATSQTAIGVITRIIVRTDAASDAECDTLAARSMDQLERDAVQGRVEVPMDCSAETWDELRVTDDRLGTTSPDSRVSQLIRVYQPGIYLLQVIAGGSVFAVRSMPLRVVPIPTREVFGPDVVRDSGLPRPTVIPVPDPLVVPIPFVRPTTPEGERQRRQRIADDIIRRQGIAPPGLGIPPTGG